LEYVTSLLHSNVNSTVEHIRYHVRCLGIDTISVYQ
jgi:hypothetical protein